MLHAFSRSEILIGAEALQKLNNSKVAIFGVGGVGAYAVEALARAGLGSFVLIDDDVVCLTNLNRQLHATLDTLGRPKVEVMKERILSINPDAKVDTRQEFYTVEKGDKLLQDDLDYVIDAIDTVSAKIDLAVRCNQMGIPIMSSMGAGNKLDPTLFRVDDIYNTSMDPLAKVMRRELRKRGVGSLKVVYSTEPSLTPRVTALELARESSSTINTRGEGKRRSIPGSISFVPPVAGLIIAGEVVKDLIGWDNPQENGRG
jgi:tRNA A37 threonylcarbamoyladenosine dehydratase